MPPDVLYAGEDDGSGYAVAARRYIDSLTQAGCNVGWRAIVNGNGGRRLAPVGHPTAQPTLTAAAERVATLTDPVAIVHCVPTTWPEIAAGLPRRRLIGQTVWEADHIPRRWSRDLNDMDELWVPTVWNADTLRRDGWNKPVHVVPHVISSDIAAPPPIELPEHRTVFVTVSTWEWRKRPDLAIEAYLRAFTSNDDVLLIVKTQPMVLAWPDVDHHSRYTWWQVMQIVRRYPNGPEIMLVTDHWTDAQIAGLLAAADCYVSLSSAEGWGLGAFDAVVAGTPAVMTGFGAFPEWAGSDYPGLVPWSPTRADHPDRQLFDERMTWAAPDVSAAANMLQSVADGSGSIRADAAEVGRRLRRTYSAEAVGAHMRHLLEDAHRD